MKKFVISTNRNWAPGNLCVAIKDTIEEVESWIRAEVETDNYDGFTAFYVYETEVTKQLIYRPEIVLNVTTREEEN